MSPMVQVSELPSAHMVRLDDGKVNALTVEAITDLCAALRRAAERDVPVIVTGRPGCLTAGLDRSVMLGRDRSAVSANLRVVTGLYETVMDLPVPVVVACPGHSLAAGALLLLVADERVGVAGPGKIGLNEVRLGIQLYPLAVAAARARLLSSALYACTVGAAVHDGQGAVDVGFLDSVTTPESLLDVALERADCLGGLDRRAFGATKRLFWAAVRTEVDTALDRSRRERAATARPA